MTEIKLGQCYMSQFSKVELPVRIERVNPTGGWTARALTHGRTVQVNNKTQLLYRLTDEEIRGIAQGVIPNRRSAIQGAVFREQTVEVTDESAEAITFKKSNVCRFRKLFSLSSKTFLTLPSVFLPKQKSR
ncbi:hypothetical protein FACS18942_05490 [Planctomycetales bacterium]|nr:hypothetical protein FACS18942_05490 [Planctomycetales bacterium]GHT37797.1 hypothetical protein FACS189427_11230 [Planctomycetales bacterium]